MPHTVPNRPTKGAVAPMVARMPVPRALRRAIAACARSSRSATRSAKPLSKAMSDMRASRSADCTKKATASVSFPVARAASLSAVLSSSAARTLSGRAGFAAQFQHLRHADRPGDERGEGETDHHDLHDNVRVYEHAPRRQIVRQQSIDRRCGEEKCRHDASSDALDSDNRHSIGQIHASVIPEMGVGERTTLELLEAREYAACCDKLERQAASIRRKPFHIAVAAPDVSTGRNRPV